MKKRLRERKEKEKAERSGKEAVQISSKSSSSKPNRNSYANVYSSDSDQGSATDDEAIKEGLRDRKLTLAMQKVCTSSITNHFSIGKSLQALARAGWSPERTEKQKRAGIFWLWRWTGWFTISLQTARPKCCLFEFFVGFWIWSISRRKIRKGS